jgi:stage V sporulation protein R
MNEGWASYWHSRIMTTRALRDSELIDYAHSHAATMGTQPGRINPYKLGVELFRHIEDRWNKGQFGKDWEECDDFAVRKRWDKQLGLGRKKIFEVRKLYNDVTFIDTFLTEDFAREQKLFTYGVNRKTSNWEIQSREFKEIKRRLLFSLTNAGQPRISVLDGNWENRGELLLVHAHEGIDLQPDWARDTLQHLHSIWTRPVSVASKVDGKGVVLRYDGRSHSEKASSIINEVR